MDGEIDSEPGVQLKDMGFTSFGQSHKRPRHHHPKRSSESAQDSMPEKPPVSVRSPVKMFVSEEVGEFGFSGQHNPQKRSKLSAVSSQVSYVI